MGRVSTRKSSLHPKGRTLRNYSGVVWDCCGGQPACEQRGGKGCLMVYLMPPLSADVCKLATVELRLERVLEVVADLVPDDVVMHFEKGAVQCWIEEPFAHGV